jgi:hypothetical protein
MVTPNELSPVEKIVRGALQITKGGESGRQVAPLQEDRCVRGYPVCTAGRITARHPVNKRRQIFRDNEVVDCFFTRIEEAEAILAAPCHQWLRRSTKVRALGEEKKEEDRPDQAYGTHDRRETSPEGSFFLYVSERHFTHEVIKDY